MLNYCRELFTYLNKHHIRYCHWKSNININDALEGKTDLDILVHRSDKENFISILYKHKCKRIYAVLPIPEIEHYLGFDQDNGTLIHLHVHYRLILGEKYTKNYRLPIEKCLLRSCETKTHILPIPVPEMELLLLTIRANLKITPFHLARCFFTFQNTFYPKSITVEFLYLLKKAKINKVIDILQEINIPISGEKIKFFLLRLGKGKLTSFQVMVFREHLFRCLHPYRRQTGLARYYDQFLNTAPHLPILHRLFVKKKTIKKGKVFALVGVDGSGKSTLAKQLTIWLSWKINTESIYYGTPKRIWYKVLDRCTQITHKTIHLGHLKEAIFLYQFISALRWLMVAKYRLSLFNQSTESMRRGNVIITDRYPLSDFHAMNKPMDGPRISKEDFHIFFPSLATKEKKYYESIQIPTAVFILQAPLDVLDQRRDMDSRIDYRDKAKAINSLSQKEEYFFVDCDRPIASVLLSIKRKIWDLL